MDINRNNYETFFLLYLDRELSLADRLSVEKFLGEHTDLKKEFTLLQQTVYTAPEIVFGEKDALFRQEKNKRTIPMFWMRLAAAIVVLVLGSWFIIARISGDQSSPAAERLTADKKSSPDASAVHKESNSQTKTSVVTVPDSSGNKNKPELANNNNRNSQPAFHNKYRKGNMTDKPSIVKNRDNSEYEAENNSAVISRSNTALEIQSAEKPSGTGTGQIGMKPAEKAPALLLAVSDKQDQPGNKNETMKDSDSQNENAISVIALNDQNKSISRFFKKLTRAAPEDGNPRKVRVSVFQISY